MRRRTLVSIVVLALGLPLAWMGRAALGKTHTTPVGELVPVARRDIGVVVKATGVIKPVQGAEVKLEPRLTGVVRRLYVRLGERVERGKLLLELDSDGFRARRDQATAAYTAATANFTYAQNDLKRQVVLAQTGAISLGALDQAERAFAVARATTLETKANLAFARAELDDTRIVSPISGIVASVTMQVGETVSVNPATSFITIIDLSQLEVWVYVDEIDIGRIKLNQTVRFSVDTYPDHEFEGEVAAIYPKPEIRDNVVNYVAAVKFVAPREQILRPEMTVSAKVQLERHAQVLSIPRHALRRDNGQQFVMVSTGVATERRVIRVGNRDEQYCEVTQGLREGELVLATNTMSDGLKKEDLE